MGIEILYICWSALTQTQKLPEVRALCTCVSCRQQKTWTSTCGFSKICQRTYIWGPCAAFCFKWDNLLYLLVLAFAISQSGFPPASETSPPSIYFQWWYQRAPREGGGAGSSCRHDSPFLGRLCRVWVFDWVSWNWVANEQQWTCPSWVFVASPNSLNKDWEVRERISIYHSLPCDDDRNSVSPPWMLTSVIIWYQTNSNDTIQWILTGVYR